MENRETFLEKFSIICSKFSDSVALYWAHDTENTRAVNYSALNRVSDELGRYFSKILHPEARYVAVEVSDYFLLPCLMLGIWKSGRSVVGIGTQYTSKETVDYLNALSVEHLITEDKCRSSCLKESDEIVSCFQVNEEKFNFWRREIPVTEKESGKGYVDMCYGIMTSGTTGTPKIIQVPWPCILLNIEELQTEFHVSESDCIYLASPCTFDPYFVELFLSILNGSSLLIVSHTIRLCSSVLMKILFSPLQEISPHLQQQQQLHNVSPPEETNKENYFHLDVKYVRRVQVTVLQMTPTLFKRWSDIEIRKVLLKETSLRVLVLGGEKFPKEILKLKCPDNKKIKIYNIYGITEISCWAFINEVTNESGETDVALGKKLKSITYKINENNELIIGSYTRVCFINDDELGLHDGGPVFRNTGDIVWLQNEKLYYLRRCNQIVKKFGLKINLNKIEDSFSKMNTSLTACFCIFDDLNLKIGLFYCKDRGQSSHIVGQTTIEKFSEMGLTYPDNMLKDIEKPDYLIGISEIPLNSHGKCDRVKLLMQLREIHNNMKCNSHLKDLFISIWNDVLGLPNSHLSSKSFEELGGTSVLALQLMNKLDDVGIKVPTNFIVELLRGKSLEECFECFLPVISKNMDGDAPEKKLKITHDTNDEIELILKWKFDLGKCVDATPSICLSKGKERLVVGSHSSNLSAIDLDTGEAIWTISLGDRIESGVAMNKDGTLGFVGCYDSFIYCFSILDGHVIWKYETGDMIKSTPCLSTDEKVIFVASYDRSLYCLSAGKGSLLKQLMVSDKGIFSSGIVSNALNSFYIATLDGTCVAVCQSTYHLKWKRKLESPVFATPCLLNDENVIFSEVVGIINCFGASDGTLVWKYAAEGLVYSSPVHYSVGDNNCIVFGCSDSRLYCLNVLGGGGGGSLKWRQQLDSSVFARPCLFTLGGSWMVCAATTKGFVYLLDLTSGEEKCKLKLKNEIFSSPVHNQETVFVGCRDNNVYALKIVVTKR